MIILKKKIFDQTKSVFTNKVTWVVFKVKNSIFVCVIPEVPVQKVVTVVVFGIIVNIQILQLDLYSITAPPPDVFVRLISPDSRVIIIVRHS